MSKGCVISWHSAGSGMRGLANYGMDKDGAQIIISNCGYDSVSIKRGLTHAIKKNQKVKNKACHLSISLPPTTAPRTSDQWQEITDKTRKELGLDDGFAYVAVRHTDTSNDHVHLIFSKISDGGKTWRDSNIRYKLPPLELKITAEFDLPPTHPDQYVTKGHVRKSEVEWKVRAGEQPPSLYIRSTIAQASINRIGIQDFIASLADAGISVRPNLKQGELSGLGYSYGGISYTGKELGCNWKNLKERVAYDKHRDGEIIADLKRQIDSGKTGSDRPDGNGATGSETAVSGIGYPDGESDRGVDIESTTGAVGDRTYKDVSRKEIIKRATENMQFEQLSRGETRGIERDEIRAESFENRQLNSRRNPFPYVYRRIFIRAHLISRFFVRRLLTLANKAKPMPSVLLPSCSSNQNALEKPVASNFAFLKEKITLNKFKVDSEEKVPIYLI